MDFHAMTRFHLISGLIDLACARDHSLGCIAEEKKPLLQPPVAGGWEDVTQPAAGDAKPPAVAAQAVASQHSTDAAAAAAPAPADFDDDVVWEDVDGDGEGGDAVEDDDVMWEETG